MTIKFEEIITHKVENLGTLLVKHLEHIPSYAVDYILCTRLWANYAPSSKLKHLFLVKRRSQVFYGATLWKGLSRNCTSALLARRERLYLCRCRHFSHEKRKPVGEFE